MRGYFRAGSKGRKYRLSSVHEVRSHDADELARCDHFGLLPERGEMPLVTGHQIIRAGRVGAFQKLVVVGVSRYLQRPPRLHRMRTARNELKQLQPEPFSNL